MTSNESSERTDSDAWQQIPSPRVEIELALCGVTRSVATRRKIMVSLAQEHNGFPIAGRVVDFVVVVPRHPPRHTQRRVCSVIFSTEELVVSYVTTRILEKRHHHRTTMPHNNAESKRGKTLRSKRCFDAALRGLDRIVFMIQEDASSMEWLVWRVVIHLICSVKNSCWIQWMTNTLLLVFFILWCSETKTNSSGFSLNYSWKVSLSPYVRAFCCCVCRLEVWSQQ